MKAATFHLEAVFQTSEIVQGFSFSSEIHHRDVTRLSQEVAAMKKRKCWKKLSLLVDVGETRQSIIADEF